MNKITATIDADRIDVGFLVETLILFRNNIGHPQTAVESLNLTRARRMIAALKDATYSVDEQTLWSVLQAETQEFNADPNTYQWVQTFKTRNLAMIAVREYWRDTAGCFKEYPVVQVEDDLPETSERRARRSTVEMVATDEDNNETLIEWTITQIAR